MSKGQLEEVYNICMCHHQEYFQRGLHGGSAGNGSRMTNCPSVSKAEDSQASWMEALGLEEVCRPWVHTSSHFVTAVAIQPHADVGVLKNHHPVVGGTKKCNTKNLNPLRSWD